MIKRPGMIFQLINIICALCATVSIAWADETSDNEVKQVITRFMEANHIPGVAVEMYVNGQPHSYYFGMANEQKKIPVSANTIFEVGSLTKLMTSLVLAQEVDSAKIQLNQPVKKYLPQLSSDFDKVTFRDLVTHTAGLEFNLPDSIKTPTQLQKYLHKLTLKNQPGQQWVYSNVSMGLLGLALEKVTHKDINELYRRKIFAPLGMQTIGTIVPKNLQRFYAQGYDAQGKAIPASTLDLLPAAWCMKASAKDMQRFLSAAIGLPGTPERIFYPMRMSETAYVELANEMQGLGWRVNAITPEKVSSLLSETSMPMGPLAVHDIYTKPMFDGDALIDKTGMTNGFRAYIALIPNKKSGIVILANRSVGGGDVVSVGRKILFSLNHIQPVPKVEEKE